VTGVTGSADYRVSHSVVKQECVLGSVLSVRGSAGEVPQPNAAHLSTDNRSVQFAGSDLTAGVRKRVKRCTKRYAKRGWQRRG